jgi:hypothetical protein
MKLLININRIGKVFMVLSYISTLGKSQMEDLKFYVIHMFYHAIFTLASLNLFLRIGLTFILFCPNFL